MIRTSWVNTMFIGNDLPELSTDLVTALTSLDVDNFSHPCFEFEISYANEIKNSNLISQKCN